MRYWYRLCPVCGEGRLFVRKADDGGALYLLCEECFCAFSTPADATCPEKALEGMETKGVFASAEDIERGGWSSFTMSEGPAT